MSASVGLLATAWGSAGVLQRSASKRGRVGQGALAVSGACKKTRQRVLLHHLLRPTTCTLCPSNPNKTSELRSAAMHTHSGVLVVKVSGPPTRLSAAPVFWATTVTV